MSKGQDFAHLEPVVTGAIENVKDIGLDENCFEHKKILSDTNYHSDANLQFAKRNKLDVYIPDPHFWQRDPRFADQGKYKPPKPRKISLSMIFNTTRKTIHSPARIANSSS